MKSAKRIFPLLLALSMFLLTGCWNYRELDSLSMVTGMAVDKGQNGYRYHLTFEFLDPTQQQPDAKLLETDGNSIFDAVRNVVGISERKLYFSDCKILVVSKDIAQEGISPIFDWAMRDQEPRATLIPVVSSEETAGELLKQEGATNPLVGIGIWHMIIQNKAALSESASLPLYQAVNLLGSEGNSMVLAAVDSVTIQNEKTPELDGSAVFKKDKLIGFLGREESKFFLLTRNEVQGGLLVFDPENNGKSITLELQGCKSQISPVVTGDSVSIQLNLEIQAALAEDETTKNYVDESGLKKSEASAQNYVKSGIEHLIQKAQTQYDSDIFGFGSKINQFAPDYWDKNKEQWPEQFKKLKCSVQVKVTIDNTATTKDKIKVSG